MPEHLQEFAERGFVVIPQAVPQYLIAAGSRTIDALMERKPPSADVRGNHFYWPEAVNVPSLIALLTESPAFSLAESLTGPGTLEVPWQVQVALNIPPFPHRPGIPHIDGSPAEPDGRPGTFTLLAGVLMSDQLDQDAGQHQHRNRNVRLALFAPVSRGATRGCAGGLAYVPVPM